VSPSADKFVSAVSKEIYTEKTDLEYDLKMSKKHLKI